MSEQIVRLRNIINEWNEEILESSLSRIWQHIEEPDRSFGVMSAFRGEFSWNENEERHAELKHVVREMGYGYIEMNGGYSGTDGFVLELSLFLPEISKSDLKELGRRYEQETVIYKDADFFGLIEVATGSVWQEFVSGSGRENITLKHPEIFKEFFSTLLKGSHRGRKFVFTVKE